MIIKGARLFPVLPLSFMRAEKDVHMLYNSYVICKDK